MRTLMRAACLALWLGATGAALDACAAPQNALNPSVSPQQRAIGPQTGGGLLYAGGKHDVEVYTFPDGEYQGVFKTSGLVTGMCSDSKGNVFMTAASQKSSESGYVDEYAHGGKAPIATLDVPKDDRPVACSSDPTTGNLAITLQNVKDYAPSIAIYIKAGGTPKIYTTPALSANPQAGYDDKGDLLATSGGNLAGELAKGASSFEKITLSQTLGNVGHVQWDGKYFALQSFYPTHHQGEYLYERIYRVQISGSNGKIVGTTYFRNWPETDPGQSWIAGSTIVATPYSHIVFWAYPAGRTPTKTIHSPHGVKAVTISAGG
jgi:hypothetical protein